MKPTIITFSILFVFIAGCTSSVVGPQLVDSAAPTPTVSEVVAPVPQTQEQIKPVVEKIASDVVELLTKHKKVISLKTAVDDGVPGAYSLLLRGDKLKKTYSVPTRYDKETLVTTIYIDRSAKTAVGICDETFACTREREGKGRLLDYESENPITPLEIINGVTFAKNVGEEKFDDRQTFILERILPDGKRERLWVEKFFGVPLQQRIFSDDTIIEKHTFTLTSFNGVSVADVSLPSSIVVS